ncbi:MAG: TetR/AcrR family transcriptional regulator, partial [Pseudomonadota bacterium]
TSKGAETQSQAKNLVPQLDRKLKALDANEVGSLKTTELLQAATGLFNRQGVAGTSLDDVVESLNLTKGALYYYFDNKEDLLTSCFDRTLKLTGAYMSAIEKETSNPLERYELALRCFVHAHTGDVGPLAVFLGLDIVSEDFRKVLANRGRELERQYEKWIRQSIDQGLTRQVNPSVARFALAGSLDWLPKWYQTGGEGSPKEIADSFASLLLDGLAAQP